MTLNVQGVWKVFLDNFNTFILTIIIVAHKIKGHFEKAYAELVKEKTETNSRVVSFPFFQINGQILYGRSHQNATTIINNAPSKVKIILIR